MFEIFGSCHALDTQIHTTYFYPPEKDENFQESKVGCPPDEDCKPNELNADLESMDNDSYRRDEEFNSGYAQHVSNDKSEEENDEAGDIDDNGEGGWEDIDKLGFAQFDVLKSLMYIYHWLN